MAYKTGKGWAARWRDKLGRGDQSRSYWPASTAILVDMGAKDGVLEIGGWSNSGKATVRIAKAVASLRPRAGRTRRACPPHCLLNKNNLFFRKNI